MSAAAPADHGPDDGAGPGTVVLFRKKSSKHGRGRREEAVPVPGEPTPEEKLAASVERLYLKHGMTLTDPDTAEAFQVAMDAMQILLKGSHAHKVIDEGQSDELLAMVEAMKAAPRLV